MSTVISSSSSSVDNDRSGKKERTYISALFMYHIYITSLTPVMRIIYKQWYSVAPWFDTLATYPKFESNSTPDRAFGFHALFSVLWMILGYIQIVWTQTHKGSIKRHHHMILGILSLIAFAGHFFSSFNIFYTDVEQHSWLNKSFLLFALLDETKDIFNGMRKIVYAKWKNKRLAPGEKRIKITRDDLFDHRFIMVYTYIVSLNGAGTVRTIGLIQTMLGVGPALCQAQYLRVGGICDWTYTWRLLLASTLTTFQCTYYVYLKKGQLDATYIKKCLRKFSFYFTVFTCFSLGITQNQTLALCFLLQVFYMFR